MTIQESKIFKEELGRYIDSLRFGSRLPKILIPLIRRSFPTFIANDIVGVQPMSEPVGLAFALRYTYETQDEDKKSSKA